MEDNIEDDYAAGVVDVIRIGTWQIPASPHAVHGEVVGHASDLGREQLLADPFRRHAERVEVIGGDVVERRLQTRRARPWWPDP